MAADFCFVTHWSIQAPLDQVYETIKACEDWPQWWQGSIRVEKQQEGDHSGVGSVYRFTWEGKIPYRFSFVLRVTQAIPGVLIEGQAEGEIVGTGRWEFTSQPDATWVTYTWIVRTNRLWMNVLAPIAKPLFKWNHDQVMRQGEQGLIRWLQAKSRHHD